MQSETPGAFGRLCRCADVNSITQARLADSVGAPMHSETPGAFGRLCRCAEMNRAILGAFGRLCRCADVGSALAERAKRALAAGYDNLQEKRWRKLADDWQMGRNSDNWADSIDMLASMLTFNVGMSHTRRQPLMHFNLFGNSWYRR